MAFSINLLGPLPQVQADEFRLSAPGVMVQLSPVFNPPILKGIKVDPNNPFRFDFILDQGSNVIPAKAGIQYQEQLKTDSTQLIKYFLASLTIPEKDLWVNLSPYEKDRIIPQKFGLTTMGRDLLAEDYMLKQITASLMYPEGQTGRKFWKRIYEEASKKFGTTNIPVNTFNKVWIIPEKAIIYENAKTGTAYIIESKLKVMLEQDYLAIEKNRAQGQPGDMFKSELQRTCPQAGCQPNTPLNLKAPQVNPHSPIEVNALSSNIIRELIIPELDHEVNQGKNFAQLRQVYNSLILATWYKKKIKDSILTQVYENKNKVAGILSSPNNNMSSPNVLIGDPQSIYQLYLKAFKKGAYNYIKEELDPITQQPIPKKYFSGGFMATDLAQMTLKIIPTIDPALLASHGQLMDVKADAVMTDMPRTTDRAMTPDQIEAGVLSYVAKEMGVSNEEMERKIYHSTIEVNNKKIQVSQYKNRADEITPFLRVGKFIIIDDKYFAGLENDVQEYKFLIRKRSVLDDSWNNSDMDYGEYKNSGWSGYMMGVLASMAAHEDQIKGASFIDFGAGQSGVLAVAAQKLGAAEIILIEGNERYMRQLKSNLVLNRVPTDICRFYQRDIVTLRALTTRMGNVVFVVNLISYGAGVAGSSELSVAFEILKRKTIKLGIISGGPEEDIYLAQRELKDVVTREQVKTVIVTKDPLAGSEHQRTFTTLMVQPDAAMGLQKSDASMVKMPQLPTQTWTPTQHALLDELNERLATYTRADLGEDGNYGLASEYFLIRLPAILKKLVALGIIEKTHSGKWQIKKNLDANEPLLRTEAGRYFKNIWAYLNRVLLGELPSYLEGVINADDAIWQDHLGGQVSLGEKIFIDLFKHIKDHRKWWSKPVPDSLLTREEYVFDKLLERTYMPQGLPRLSRMYHIIWENDPRLGTLIMAGTVYHIFNVSQNEARSSNNSGHVGADLLYLRLQMNAANEVLGARRSNLGKYFEESIARNIANDAGSIWIRTLVLTVVFGVILFRPRFARLQHFDNDNLKAAFIENRGNVLRWLRRGYTKIEFPWSQEVIEGWKKGPGWDFDVADSLTNPTIQRSRRLVETEGYQFLEASIQPQMLSAVTHYERMEAHVTGFAEHISDLEPVNMRDLHQGDRVRIDEQNETDTKKETPIISVHAVVADREFDDAGHVYMWVIPFGMGDEIFVDESKKIKAMYRLTVKDEAVKSRLESLDMASTSEVPGYSEALTKYKAWIAAGRMGTLHETWAKSSRSDVINYFTVALEENIPGFRKARLDDDVPLMANLYRRYVIGYQIQDGNRIGGQKGFLYYKCGLGSLSGTSRPFFENTDGNPGSLLRLAGEKRELLKGIVSKEGLKSWEFEEKPANLQEDDGLDYEAAKSYYSNWQRSVRRFNFPNGFWYLEKTIANFVLVVLDNNIPGFKDARDRGDIKLMAALYRRYVIWYKAENPQKYPDRQVAFFNEKGGLQRLVATHRLLSKGNMPWALMRWLTKKGGVLYGLMDEHNEEALNPLEIDPNQEEIPSDGLSYDVMKQHYEIWRDKVGKLGFSDMFWRKSKTAANAVAIVLDENILGFRDAREHDNVALMDALFLEGPVRIGLRKFFYDNGLSGLLERPPTYLNRPVTAGSLLRLAGSFGLLGHFLTDRQRLTPEELDFAVSPPMKVTGPAASHTGGIDLTSGKTLLVQNSGLSLHFHIDPAMLKHLHDSLGFTPRIITIQPMNDLRDFLGL